VGNNRNYCAALLTLDGDAVRRWAKERGGLEGLTLEAFSRDARVVALIQGCIDAVNQTLAGYESIKKFVLLPDDFSVDTGELTASLKVKRKVVELKYQALLDSLYEGSIEGP
jgi:long-chain acyl-CoA synthetase